MLHHPAVRDFANRTQNALGRSCGLSRIVRAECYAIARHDNSSRVNYRPFRSAQALDESQTCGPFQNEAIVGPSTSRTNARGAPARGRPLSETVLRSEPKMLWIDQADCAASGHDPTVAGLPAREPRTLRCPAFLRIEPKMLWGDRADCRVRLRAGRNRAGSRSRGFGLGPSIVPSLINPGRLDGRSVVVIR